MGFDRWSQLVEAGIFADRGDGVYQHTGKPFPAVGPSMPVPDAGKVMAQPADPNVKTTTTETTKTVTEPAAPVTPAEPSVDAKRQAARNATDKATIHRGMGGPGAGARGQKQGLGA